MTEALIDETAESAREIDRNGYVTIYDNPITRAGIFQYKGSQLPGGDPHKIYNVYRPLEELTDPETLESFKGLPIIDEHEMLGGKYPRSPEDRGVHGSILESMRVKGRDIVANLRIWSRTLKALIDAGKKGLSLGYNCRWEKTSGVFEGIAYDYIQRNIRGNHLALVTQGRSGTAVLDQHDVLDHFDLALDTKELTMADDKDKKDEKETKTEAKNDAPGGEKEEKQEMGVDDVHAWAKANMPKIHEFMKMMAAEADDGEEDGDVLDGDTKEKSGDQALDKDEKDEKKEDKAMDKSEGKAMDAADVERIVTSKIKAARKEMRTDIVKRDALVKDLTPLVGTFDASAMDSDDVAAYGVEKLGLQAGKADPHAVLSGYLAGVKKAGNSQIGYAMDSAIKAPKEGGKLAARLNNAA